MNAAKGQLVKFHPPNPESPVHPHVRTRTGRVVDVNAKPAAVKVGGYLAGEHYVKVRRRWIPVAWVECAVQPTAPAEKPIKKGRR